MFDAKSACHSTSFWRFASEAEARKHPTIDEFTLELHHVILLFYENAINMFLLKTYTSKWKLRPDPFSISFCFWLSRFQARNMELMASLLCQWQCQWCAPQILNWSFGKYTKVENIDVKPVGRMISSHYIMLLQTDAIVPLFAGCGFGPHGKWRTNWSTLEIDRKSAESNCQGGSWVGQVANRWQKKHVLKNIHASIWPWRLYSHP